MVNNKMAMCAMDENFHMNKKGKEREEKKLRTEMDEKNIRSREKPGAMAGRAPPWFSHTCLVVSSTMLRRRRNHERIKQTNKQKSPRFPAAHGSEGGELAK
jgi:hypothetical protein